MIIDTVKKVVLFTLPLFIFLLLAEGVYALSIDNDGNIYYSVTKVLSVEDEKEEEHEVELEQEQEEENEQESHDEEKDEPSDRVKYEENEDGKESTTEIYENGQKIKIEVRDDETTVKVESDNEEDNFQLKLNSGEEIDIGDDSSGSGQIRIRTKEEKYVITRNRVAARTYYPLSVNLETNELMVTTPDGDKKVVVLPDEAVQSILANNVLDMILDSFETPGDKTSDDIEEEVELVTQNEELVYKIIGIKSKKLLGIYDVGIEKTVYVSAETSEVTGINRDIMNTILEVFSF